MPAKNNVPYAGIGIESYIFIFHSNWLENTVRNECSVFILQCPKCKKSSINFLDRKEKTSILTLTFNPVLRGWKGKA